MSTFRRFLHSLFLAVFTAGSLIGPLPAHALLKATATPTVLTNPTFTGTVTGSATIVSKSGIPLIKMPSGSVAANGAISGITALPVAYANAYCYFPANALATTIAAGWHYCTFSTTTAGTAYLDTYTSGTPTIPSSPTAVTDGKGAYTGVTAEVVFVDATVGAGVMGSNGFLYARSQWRENNTAGNKTLLPRWSGGGGTAILNATNASLTGRRAELWIHNNGNASSQVVEGLYQTSGNALASTIGLRTSVNTGSATSIAWAGSTAVATDYLILEAQFVLLYTDGT